jgi:hypothetical protein
MSKRRGIIWLLGILAMAVPSVVLAQNVALPADRNAIVITFKDGRQQTFSLSEVARIEFKSAAVAAPQIGRGNFPGKWRVGDGNGGTFFITLDRDGTARKSIGASHGTWTVVDGEARISWDDGWHDIIRKVGNKYEKFAYEPNKSFSDQPSNVTDAVNTEPQPI